VGVSAVLLLGRFHITFCFTLFSPPVFSSLLPTDPKFPYFFELPHVMLIAEFLFIRLRPVEDVAGGGIENVDVTDKIAGHMSYRAFMPLILDELGFEVVADFFDDPEVSIRDFHSILIFSCISMAVILTISASFILRNPISKKTA
jgi:hypothetical protein